MALGTSSSTGSTPSSDESSTGEPQFEGPGCGEPPACDRGTFDGHVRIESAEDLAEAAGFTEITGALEIMNSQDLVCLDALACLEVVGRDVRIQDNAALRSTQGLSALREVGQERSGQWSVAGDVIVAHNVVLERLAGFSVQEVHRSLLILENPRLRVVSGFRDLRTLNGLHVTANPNLESLVGLAGVEAVSLCNVSFNDSLCVTEVFEVCGGLETQPSGTASYNRASCQEVPGEIFRDVERSWECSFRADDCPPGQKCVPVAIDGGSHEDYAACRPVVVNPARPGEPCSQLGGEAEGLDTCERHSTCRDDVCVAMCRGGDEQGACLRPEEFCHVNGSGSLVLCLDACDPILQNCPDGEGCYLVDNSFQCAPAAALEPTGSGDGCEFINACDAGLICLNPGVRSDCPPNSGGCCVETCDFTASDCPPAFECAALYEPFPSFPGNLPRHLENVGICVDPS